MGRYWVQQDMGQFISAYLTGVHLFSGTRLNMVDLLDELTSGFENTLLFSQALCLLPAVSYCRACLVSTAPHTSFCPSHFLILLTGTLVTPDEWGT
jgi:hypothetical protein